MTSPLPYDYAKYHGLGNDYLVMDPARFTARFSLTGAGLPGEAVRLICDRHRGVGADGILLGPLPARNGTAGVRIFNPDGSEAERSGNGLRVFARYLWDRKLTGGKSSFPIALPGGQVSAEIKDYRGRLVSVGVGRYSFHSSDIPVAGEAREVINEPLQVGAERLTVCCVSVGNPHCVVVDRNPSPEIARRLGPALERHAWFPNRTNVQFMRVRDRRSIEIEIWERGAGYTLASGTSSCAAAAVAVRLGLCEWPVAVHMPGGMMTVAYLPGSGLELTGPVAAVSLGDFAPELLTAVGLTRSAGAAAGAASSRPAARAKQRMPKSRATPRGRLKIAAKRQAKAKRRASGARGIRKKVQAQRKKR